MTKSIITGLLQHASVNLLKTVIKQVLPKQLMFI